MVGHPAEDEESCSCDGAGPEDQVLRIVLCDFADPLVGEGWFLLIILGLPVDDEDAGDGKNATCEVEDSW